MAAETVIRSIKRFKNHIDFPLKEARKGFLLSIAFLNDKILKDGATDDISTTFRYL